MTDLEKRVLAFIGEAQGRNGEYEITGPKRLATRSQILKAMNDVETPHAISRLWARGYLRRPQQRPREPWRFMLTPRGWEVIEPERASA